MPQPSASRIRSLARSRTAAGMCSKVSPQANSPRVRAGADVAGGVEFTIIRDVSTANLAFAVDKLDWIGMAIPLLKDVKGQAPEAICEVAPGSGRRNLIVNRDTP